LGSSRGTKLTPFRLGARPRVIEATLLWLRRCQARRYDPLARSSRSVGPGPTATLAAHTCITVCEVAFSQWISDGEDRSLVDLEREALAQLATLAADLGPG
jgi:hypothetical protein